MTKQCQCCRYARKYEDGGKEIQDSLAQLKEHASAIRVLVHTQPRKVNIGFQKAHMMEIQINGGSIADKVDFAYRLFEKEVRGCPLLGCLGSVFFEHSNP